MNPLAKHFIERALRKTRRRVTLSVCAAVYVALGAIGSAARGPVEAPRTEAFAADSSWNHTSIKPAVAARPGFRLGTGAKPFAWSTAVADFDSDGTPDVAVADHVGRPAGAYAYRIEVVLSGHDANAVFFESTAEAVTIRSFDIDHDNDLDIVVGRALGGDAVAVWLNDGQGNFTSADARRFPSTIEGLPALGTEDSPEDGVAFESSPRRIEDVRLTAPCASTSISIDRLATSNSDALFASPFVLRRAPRAPPQHSIDI